MIRNSRSGNKLINLYPIGVISILFINLAVATVYYPKSPDNENSVISEGIWQKDKTKPEQGASSRLDVSGVLTNLGNRQGSSLFTLVTFPLLLPIIVLVGVALFLMSAFGTNGFAAVGRRSDIIGSSFGSGNSFSGFDYLPPGYKLDRNGFPSMSLTNRQGFAFGDATPENDTCMERLACELMVRGGPKVIGKKITLSLLRELGVKPIILPNSSPGKKSRKVWNCSTFPCNWEKWIPWAESTIP